MIIIGVDFHPEFQQIAWVDTDSGELEERQLRHREEAEAFYRGLVTEGKRRCAWAWKPADTHAGLWIARRVEI